MSLPPSYLLRIVRGCLATLTISLTLTLIALLIIFVIASWEYLHEPGRISFLSSPLEQPSHKL